MDLKKINILLEYGSDIDMTITNKDNISPLMIFLISLSNYKLTSGRSSSYYLPIHIRSLLSNEESVYDTIQLLCRYGSKLDLNDHEGHTLVSIAIDLSRVYPDIITIIQNYSTIPIEQRKSTILYPTASSYPSLRNNGGFFMRNPLRVHPRLIQRAQSTNVANSVLSNNTNG